MSATNASKQAAEIVEEMKPFIIDDPHKRHYALERLSGRIEGKIAEAEARGAERMRERCCEVVKAVGEVARIHIGFSTGSKGQAAKVKVRTVDEIATALAALPLEEGKE